MEIKQTSIGYYGGQLQRIAAELQGLGYTVSSTHSNLVGPIPRGPQSSELMSIAGSAARLKVQIDHVLSQLQQLCLAGEATISGEDKQ